ncbi:MAG: glycosyltransferase [Actinomycetia bacterium]|nr:glycosyltransferase [Actinomycetes bacterium]
MRPSRPRVLLLGHYPLHRPDRAPVVRTRAMAEALARHAEVRVVAGTRAARAPALLALLRSGGLSGVDGVYLESATSAMTPVDWWFLRAVRRRGLPLAVYVRDWYQRFPDLYPPRGPKERVLAALYAATLAAYRRLATTLFVPTDGLGRLLGGPYRLLPPAGAVLPEAPGPRVRGRLVYVGANGPYDGVDLALEAVARLGRPTVELVLVLRPREAPAAVPPGVRVVAASGADLSAWLWSAELALLPRRDTAYNRIALPVKLFDYWSHGLPVLATGNSEVGRWVARVGGGVAVPATAEALAAALDTLLDDPVRLRTMGERGRAAVRSAHNWDARALTVLDALGLS